MLLTGRGSSVQWHTGTRTDKVASLRSLAPEGLWIDLHPDDAARRDLLSGDDVLVESARGSVRARVKVTANVGAGQVFLPMHHPEVNILTFPEFDPISRQPSYKHCAVQVRRPRAGRGA